MKEIAVSCGWTIVRTRIHRKIMTADIMMPGLYDEETSQPPQHIDVHGEENIRKLRNALNEALEETTP